MSETVFSSSYQPDPKSALDVLAFVLTPATAFASDCDPEELAAVAEMLDSAKKQALERWFALHGAARRS